MLDVLDKLPVVIIDALGIEHELVEIVNVLLYDIGDVFQLSQLVAVVVLEHALRAHDRVAELAKVFDLLVLMLEAEHFS